MLSSARNPARRLLSPPPRLHVVLAFVLVAGTVLSTLLFLASLEWERRRTFAEFERSARNAVAAFRRRVESSVNAVYAVASLYAASQVVERSEFEEFVTHLLARNPGLRALEWVPRVPFAERAGWESRARRDGFPAFEVREWTADGSLVPAAARDEYFPVYFVVPWQGNEPAHGFDLASDPTWDATLERARDTGEATATAGIRLVQEASGQHGILVLQPVYEKGRATGTEAARRLHLQGFVLGVLSVGDLLDHSLALLDAEELEFRIVDTSAPPGERVLHTRRARESTFDAHDVPAREGSLDGLVFESRVPVAGRTWAIECTPAPAYVSASDPRRPWLLLAGGLLLTAMLAAFVLLVRRGMTRTQRHAHELLVAKEGLEQEVAERRSAEEELRLLYAAVEQSTEGVAVVDLEGRVLFVNHSFAKMHGRGLEEVVGRSLEIFHTPDQMPAVEAANAQLRKTGSFSGEVFHVHRDGTVFPGEMRNSLVRDESGTPVAMVGTLRDVTERRRMEEEALKGVKLESLGLLAGGIAHDFNNLLTAITGNLSLARQLRDDEEGVFRRLAEAEKASARAQGLTQQLLTFSKGGVPVKEAVSLAQLVTDTVDFVLRGTNVRCEFELPADLWTVEVDAGQMSRVISNLAINAVQAMPDGGTLRVVCSNEVVPEGTTLPIAAGRYTKLSMADEGTGIPRDHLPRIFDPYFTTKREGSGLGLPSAYSIVRKHEGHIAVESRLSAGTRFDVYLPASDRVQAEEEPTDTEEAIEGGRILVMDDEDMVRDVLGEMLRSLYCDVEFAADGAEAIRHYREAKETGRPFDLVMLDLTVPGGMGGKDALVELRRYDPAVRAIVSSGYSNDPVVAEFREHGFRGILPKPYTLSQLRAALGRVLAEP